LEVTPHIGALIGKMCFRLWGSRIPSSNSLDEGVTSMSSPFIFQHHDYALPFYFVSSIYSSVENNNNIDSYFCSLFYNLLESRRLVLWASLVASTVTSPASGFTVHFTIPLKYLHSIVNTKQRSCLFQSLLSSFASLLILHI
jgi:hypothetical protein